MATPNRTKMAGGTGRNGVETGTSAGPGGDRTQLGVMGKALSVLDIISTSAGPVAISEIVRRSGLTKPTAHRITAMLADMGFIERDPERRGFVEGPRLITLALDTLRAAAPRSMRHAILRSLSEATGETCNFGVLSGAEVIYLDRVESKWPLGLRFEAGSRVPAHCTALGKLLISQLSAGERRAVAETVPLTRYTSRTITARDAFAQAIERARAERIGIDDQEFIEGVVCVSVPVVTKSGRVIGGIAMSAPEARFTLDDALGFVPLMRDAAGRLAATYEFGAE